MEIHQQIYRGTYQRAPNIVTETLDTEIPEASNQRQKVNNNKQDTTHPNAVEQIITPKKMNVEIMKRLMSEKKTALPSLRNQHLKTVIAETEKINDL